MGVAAHESLRSSKNFPRAGTHGQLQEGETRPDLPSRAGSGAGRPAIPARPAAPWRRGRALDSGNPGVARAPGRYPQTHSASRKDWNPTVTGWPARV